MRTTICRGAVTAEDREISSRGGAVTGRSKKWPIIKKKWLEKQKQMLHADENKRVNRRKRTH